MGTVRREPERVRLPTWGNADAVMLQAWNAPAWAFAAAGNGLLAVPDGPQSAADFRRQADLPAALGGG